ncbi:hypothetical protein SAMN05444358_11333 [Ruegeria halocynthiae]|uniref:Uncharacterized protein n=1 Tax=Ruegeria halocynthiae TaxID=985054 RepID=A0A1H3F3V0_9RHOB|nr:hypothetical protein SAMN05444358_11333 [Ruegeria halocynthiae]
MILEIRIFSIRPRNSFALGGNLHAGKRVPPLFQPEGVDAGGLAQGNHAPHGLREQRPSHTGTFKFIMAFSARLSALNFPPPARRVWQG